MGDLYLLIILYNPYFSRQQDLNWLFQTCHHIPRDIFLNFIGH